MEKALVPIILSPASTPAPSSVAGRGTRPIMINSLFVAKWTPSQPTQEWAQDLSLHAQIRFSLLAAKRQNSISIKIQQS